MNINQEVDLDELLTKDELSKLSHVCYWELTNGSFAIIGTMETANKFFIKFKRRITEDGKLTKKFKDFVFTCKREEFDALISMYFEMYSLQKCEAVLIHKLLLKRGFSDKKTLETAKVIAKSVETDMIPVW